MAFDNQAGSILAVDIGTVTTRAVLFDMVGGVYRFIGRGEAPTTNGQPWNDVGEGLRAALMDMSASTGRQLLDEEENLLTPEEGGSGVDSFVASISAGKAMRTVLVGLMPDVSLTSARRAAEETYLDIQDVFSIADPRSREEQVDALLEMSPELIIIVGGTDDSASPAMKNQIDTVIYYCLLAEENTLPRIVYAGNSALQDDVKARLEERLDMEVVYAGNVRPTLQTESLDSIKSNLKLIYQLFQTANVGGFTEVTRWSEIAVLPTAQAFRRTIHFMGQREEKAILGVDLGSTRSVVAASLDNKPYFSVTGELGLGHKADGVLNVADPAALARWLVTEFEDEETALQQVRNFVLNKSLYPATIPHSMEELDFELALVREVLRGAIKWAMSDWMHGAGGLPAFEEIVACGSALGNMPHPGYSALAILDALQPVGVVDLNLDAYGIVTGLGLVAEIDPQATVEVLSTGGFLHLGTAICASGQPRQGRVVLQAELTPAGQDSLPPISVEGGTLASLPLQAGMRAHLKLRPRGANFGRKRDLEVVGGALGVIIDTRGRELKLSNDPVERRAQLQKWRDALVGKTL